MAKKKAAKANSGSKLSFPIGMRVAGEQPKKKAPSKAKKK